MASYGRERPFLPLRGDLPEPFAIGAIIANE